MYDLGSAIKTMRLKRKMTQRTLARRINKSVSAISSYEANTQVPPMDVLVSIASALNISLDYLAGFSKDCIYITNGLSPNQKEFIDTLFTELTNPSSNGNELSDNQIRIIQKLISLFLEKS